MFRFIARHLFRVTLCLAGLLLIGTAGTVHAQNIAVFKDLCGPAGCISQTSGTSPSVPPNAPVYYSITLYNNDPTPVTVDLQETFQPGFHALSSDCGTGSPPLPMTGGSTFLGPLLLPPMTTTICRIDGYFEYLSASQNNANNVVTVYASTDHLTSLATSNVINATVDGTAPIPTDVSVTKTATITSIDSSTGAVTVHYTVTIKNNGPNDVYDFLLQDRLSVPATGVPLIATYSNGLCNIVTGAGTSPGTSTCFGQVPSISNSPLTVLSTSPTDFLQWSYPTGTPGLLRSLDSMVIEFDVVITTLPNLNCVQNLLGNALINAVHFSFNVPGSTTTIQDSNAANNTASASVPVMINAPVDPTCGTSALQVSKTQDTVDLPGGLPWGSTVAYTITLKNLSTTQTIGNIKLFDVINGSLGDLVQAGVGTPPFTAELVSLTCPPGVCTGSVGTTQILTGYGDTKWMFGTTVYAPPNITDLAPLASVSFQLGLIFSNPGCDSYPDVARKPVINFVRASYQDTALGVIVMQSAPVTTYMQALPACQFTVQKSVDGSVSKIAFVPPAAPTSASYTMTFGNPTAQVATIGTLIDTLRIVQSDYASQLPVDYSYTCTPSPSGSVSGYPGSTPVSGSVNVIYTSLAQQGVRIIQNSSPVIFQPQSMLTCNVTIKVARPSAGDPNCARLGELENAAIVDSSAFYNPNLNWPSGTDAGNSAKVSLPLPQCLNLVVNKTVNPIWTTQNSLLPLNYTLTVTNFGAPILPTDGVTLSDNFTPNNYSASSPWTTVCANPSTCSVAPTWSPDPTLNPSTLNISALAQNQSIITNFPVNGPYPAPAPPPSGRLCNHAGAAVMSLSAGDWYAKDPATWQTDLCAPVFDVRSLDINKAVIFTPPANVPPVVAFTVNVNCSYVVSGVQYGPNTTVSFTFPLNPATQTVQNVPVGSVCTIAELPLPAPVAMSSCPSGFGVWGPVVYTNPDNPGGAPQSLTIVTSHPNRLGVENTFACEPAGMLSVTKTFDPSSPASQFPPSSTFPILVACTGRPNVVVNLTPPNYQQTVPDLPIGTVCTITELAPVGTDVQPNCYWDTSYPNGQSVTMPSGSVNLQVRNKLRCTGTVTIYKTFEPSTLASQIPSVASFPIQVACTPGSTTTINLNSSNNFQFQTPSMPTGTVCSITELAPVNAPPSANCHWAPTIYTKGQSVTIPNGSASLVAQNSWTCTGPASLTINKTTTNLSPIMMPNPLFPVTVNCQSGSSGTILFLTPNAGSQSVSNITAGSNCTITETAPPMLPPIPYFCQWVTSLIWSGVSHPNGSQITNVQGLPDPRNIEVHNDFVCIPPLPGTGALTVKKTIIYDTVDHTNQPNGDFQIFVSCTNPVSSYTLPLSWLTYPNSYQGTLLNIPVGSQCTIDETLPQVPSALPSGSMWVLTYPAGQQVTIVSGNQIFLLSNERINHIVPPGQSTLWMGKSFSIQGAFDPNHTMTFQIDVSCTDPSGLSVSGFPQTVSMTPNYVTYMDGSAAAVTYHVEALLNVPTGSTCSINEPTLPPLSASLATCSWAAGTPTYSHRNPGGSVQSGSSITLSVSQQSFEISANNHLICP